MMMPGGFECPKNSPGRVVASMWWLISIIVYAVYTGNLIAFLTVTEQKMPFDTLQAMVRQSQYKYGLERGIVQQTLFQVNTQKNLKPVQIVGKSPYRKQHLEYTRISGKGFRRIEITLWLRLVKA
jgi:hypothetical protein